MKKQILILFIVIVAVCFGFFARRILRTPERTFGGKPERFWIDSLINSGGGSDVVKKWQALGSEGVRILINAMEKGNGRMDRGYSKIWPKLPDSVRNNLPRPVDSHWLRKQAASLVWEMGSNALIAVPALTRALEDDDLGVRGNAASSLSMLLPMMGNQRAELLPDLLQALQDSDASKWGRDAMNACVRNNVVCGLRYYLDQAEIVVPVLLKSMKDPDSAVRLMAAESLTFMGFEDSAKRVPQLMVPTMVPALIETLQFEDADTRSLSARELGEFGPSASAAVPALLRALEDTDLATRMNATNALKKIDPEIAATLDRGF